MTEPLPPAIAARLTEGAFLLVDKPRGPSSHQVTAWVRDLIGVERAGHAGTLDPNVSGLLWIGIGPALKLIPLVLEFPKRYIGVAVLHGAPPAAELARVLSEFEGPIYQTPPVRSAVKRERRIRTVHRLHLVESDGTQLLLDVTADSGTYIRSLAVDIGEALGIGGHLVELRRVGTGPFTEQGSISLTTLADALQSARAGAPEALQRALHPMKEVWGEFPTLVLKESAASAVAHGSNLAAGGILGEPSRPFSQGAAVVLVTRRGDLVATGTALFDSKEFSSVKHGWVVDSDRVYADAEKFPTLWRQARAAPRPEPGG